MFLQVGDGASVFKGESDLELAIPPEKGEYVSETRFATEPSAYDALRSRFVMGRVSQVALFTDGIESLVLTESNRTPHPPFFCRLFEDVLGSPEGQAQQMFQCFIEDSVFDEGSDDDRTLVVAVRGSKPG